MTDTTTSSQNIFRIQPAYNRLFLLFLFPVVCFFTGLLSYGDDWPVSRGNPASTALATGKIPEQPKVLWQFKTENAKSGFEGTPVIADSRIFVGDFEGVLHAIELKTGKELWTANINKLNESSQSKSVIGFMSAAAVNQGKVVIGDFNGKVYCFEASNGKHVWTYEIDQQVASGANFYGNSALVTSESGSMFALDLNTGELKWSYATGDQLRSSPTIWKTFSLLGGCDGRLHKIDLDSGMAVGDGIALEAPTLSTPSVIGNIAIVPTQPGVVLAIDVSTNKVHWTFADQAISSDIRSSPATQGKMDGDLLIGITVVTTKNRRVLGLNLENGNVVWETVLKKRCDNSPVICDGRAWVASVDGMVYAIDIKNGEEKWSYQLQGQILASPAIADGKFIVATEKGSIVCFGQE